MKLIDCDDDEEDDSYLSDEAGDRRYKVVFHLYGVTQADIDEVIKEIDELGNEAVSDRVIDDVENQAHIAKLTADQVIRDLDIFRWEFPTCVSLGYHCLGVKTC